MSSRPQVPGPEPKVKANNPKVAVPVGPREWLVRKVHAVPFDSRSVSIVGPSTGGETVGVVERSVLAGVEAERDRYRETLTAISEHLSGQQVTEADLGNVYVSLAAALRGER